MAVYQKEKKVDKRKKMIRFQVKTIIEIFSYDFLFFFNYLMKNSNIVTNANKQ